MSDIPLDIPIAPAWSLWAGQLGKGCIWAAFGFFLIACLLWFFRPRSQALEGPAKFAFTLGSLCLFTSFGVLALLFVKDQFQFDYVFQHGDTETDLKYKIAGVWTAQEGSFLLWACTSALFGVLSVRGTGPYRRWFTIAYSLFLGTLAAILAYETPFNLNPIALAHGKVFVPTNGMGMTASLQNYWVVIHPPTIFSGFGSLTVFFAYGIAAMLTGARSGPVGSGGSTVGGGDWPQRVRPWTLITTGILGLGICMGGLWAYETLGWGGFWAWDPVEIASFIPWLFTVVLAHGLIVQVTKKHWTKTNLLLCGLPFIAFAYGTFLTRSGLLDKVSNHSFAEMDKHALVVLRWFVIAVTAGYVSLWAWAVRRVPRAEPDPQVPGVTREGFYRFGMMLLSMTAVVVTLGMSWPVITALRTGQGSKVEEPLYHLVVVWFFIPMMLAMAVAPFVGWAPMGWKTLLNRISNVASVAIGLTGFLQLALMAPNTGVHAEAGATVATPFHGKTLPLPYWMMLLTFVCIFVIVANVWRIAEISRRSPGGIGGFVAHLGIATLLGGLILSRGYEQKAQVFVRDGSPASALGYIVTYKGRTSLDPFDRNGKVFFDVQTPSGEHFEASPGYYLWGPREEPKQAEWPSIQHYPTHDIYLAMAEPAVAVWNNPLRLIPGQKVNINGTTVEYVKPTREGRLGQTGVSFGAVVKLTETDDSGQLQTYVANPTVKLTDQGLIPDMPRLSPDYVIAMVGGMDASDRGVNLMLMFSPPIFPIELYYKPLTWLVWLGMGVMTTGGLMSAWSRRRVAKRVPVVVTETEQMGKTPAPVPA